MTTLRMLFAVLVHAVIRAALVWLLWDVLIAPHAHWFKLGLPGFVLCVVAFFVLAVQLPRIP